MPKHLRQQFLDAQNRKAKIRAANAIYTWVSTQQTQFPAGLSYDPALNAVQFDVEKFLRQRGWPVTEETKDQVLRVFQEICAKEFPGVPQTVVAMDDLDPGE